MGWDWINNIVIELRKNYLSNSPYEICRCLKIKIERVDPHFYLLYGKKSIYFKSLYGEEIIYIRNDLFGADEEFTLNHELGHVFLHNNISCSAHINTDKLDKQADYFALALKGITFDSIEKEGMSLYQIASLNKVPYEPLFKVINA